MSKVTTATKVEKGASAHVLCFERPTRTINKPLIFEFVPPANVDRICQSIGENVTTWTTAKLTAFSSAIMSMAARTRQAFVMIAYDVEMIWAASFPKLGNWANGIVFRCVAALASRKNRTIGLSPSSICQRPRPKLPTPSGSSSKFVTSKPPRLWRYPARLRSGRQIQA